MIFRTSIIEVGFHCVVEVTFNKWFGKFYLIASLKLYCFRVYYLLLLILRDRIHASTRNYGFRVRTCVMRE